MKVVGNNKTIILPPIIPILLIHKFKVRRIVKKLTLRYHMMIKKGNTLFTLTSEEQKQNVDLWK